MEFFDKDKKTKNEDLESKLKLVHAFSAELSAYHKMVDSFCTNSLCISLFLILLAMIDAHQMLGKSLVLLYDQSALQFYIHSVNAVLQEGEHARNKVEMMQKNAKRLVDLLAKLVEQMKALEKEREEARVLFDHYRNKMAKLEKTHMKAPEPKKVQKYERNLQKFEAAKARFSERKRALELLMDQIREKSEVIIDQIVFKFSREVEAEFYRQISAQFDKLQDMEEQMREAANSAMRGHYGRVGGNLNLDVNF